MKLCSRVLGYKWILAFVLILQIGMLPFGVQARGDEPIHLFKETTTGLVDVNPEDKSFTIPERALDQDNFYAIQGGDAECDRICEDEVPENEPQVEAAKRETDPNYQLYAQCKAYKAEGIAIQLSNAMAVVDALAFATCAGACASSVAGSLAVAPVAACSAIALGEGMLDVSATIAIQQVSQRPWNSMDTFSTVLGAAGIVGGGASLGALKGTAGQIKQIKNVKGGTK